MNVRGFPPWRSCGSRERNSLVITKGRKPLAVPVSAKFTPSRGHPITRASRAPQTWMECGPTPAAISCRGSAKPVFSCTRRPVLRVGIPDGATPVVYRIKRARFTPALFVPRVRHVSEHSSLTEMAGGSRRNKIVRKLCGVDETRSVSFAHQKSLISGDAVSPPCSRLPFGRRSLRKGA